jgi:hypothetical protein
VRKTKRNQEFVLVSGVRKITPLMMIWRLEKKSRDMKVSHLVKEFRKHEIQAKRAENEKSYNPSGVFRV